MTLYENILACMPVWGMALGFGFLFGLRALVDKISGWEDDVQ